jgi:hypothetical protein
MTISLTHTDRDLLIMKCPNPKSSSMGSELTSPPSFPSTLCNINYCATCAATIPSLGVATSCGYPILTHNRHKIKDMHIDKYVVTTLTSGYVNLRAKYGGIPISLTAK